MNNNRTIIITTLLSLIFHGFFISYYSKVQEQRRKALEELREVELIEEQLPRNINPKVIKFLAKEKAKESKGEKAEQVVVKKKINLEVPGVERIDIEKSSIEKTTSTAPIIDLSASGGIKEPQGIEAKINLTSFEAGNGLEGVDEVISITGKGKSIKEILEEPPAKISLTSSETSTALGEEGAIIAGGGTSIPGGKIKLVESSEPEVEEEVASIREVTVPKRKISLSTSKSKKTESKPLISLSGPLAKRKIVKKYSPRYPAWALREGAEGTVSLKFWVSTDGHVKSNIVILKSSGYPELDRAAINALKMWIFEPGSKEEWGILTVIFQLI